MVYSRSRDINDAIVDVNSNLLTGILLIQKRLFIIKHVFLCSMNGSGLAINGPELGGIRSRAGRQAESDRRYIILILSRYFEDNLICDLLY